MQEIIIVLSILFSALFSGSETVFISASLTRLEVLVKQNIRGAKMTYKFLRNPENYLVTILAGNNITVVVFSSYAALYLRDIVPESLIVFISSIVILLFGEIIPKSISREIANRVVIYCTFLMKPIHWLLFPVTYFFERSTRFLSRLFHAEQQEEMNLFSKKDIMHFFSQSSNRGVIESEKGMVINKILNLKEMRIREVMNPRIDIVAIEKNATLESAEKLFQSTGLSRILVYEKYIENIIGKIHVKDLFDNPESVAQITREVIIVPEMKTAYAMLLEFKRTKAGLAAVIDEHGSLSGVVSVEDVVEELFGEISDEHDQEDSLYRKLSPRRYLIHARLEIDFANEFLKFNLPQGNYETVGGLILTHLGRIPKKNEVFVIGTWRIVIIEASSTSIGWVKFVKRRVVQY